VVQWGTILAEGQMLTVLLVDDHEVVREGTRKLLERAGDLQVVGEAADGEDAVRQAQTLRPQVVLMDVRMPGLSGLEATRRIKASVPATRILVLTAYDEDQYVFPLLQAGADGYLLKTTGGRELIQAVRDVAAGRSVLDPQITGKVVSHATGRPRGYRGPEMVESLTEREIQVLQSVARGLSNKEIADALVLSTYTVQVHLRNIFGKLNVSSRTEAVTYALAQGWIKLDSRK
jgi:DNA-binding NarL/FixJ family response regulator